MHFIKEVLKKLLIAIVTGAVILAFVYYKDHYLEQGNSDMEMLDSVTLEKKTQDEKIIEKKTDTTSAVGKEVKVEQNSKSDQDEPPLAIEVEKPYKEPEVQATQQEKALTKEETPAPAEETVTIKEKKVESKKVEEELENEMKQYRESPQEVSILSSQNSVSQKKQQQQDSFDEFKSSVKSRAQSAFDELDNETK